MWYADTSRRTLAKEQEIINKVKPLIVNIPPKEAGAIQTNLVYDKPKK